MTKFSDIMKKFYEDEMLGIKNEDAPANSVASGGVSMPADAVSKKKQKEIQKKNIYDGRRKEAKSTNLFHPFFLCSMVSIKGSSPLSLE